MSKALIPSFERRRQTEKWLRFCAQELRGNHSSWMKGQWSRGKVSLFSNDWIKFTKMPMLSFISPEHFSNHVFLSGGDVKKQSLWLPRNWVCTKGSEKKKTFLWLSTIAIGSVVPVPSVQSCDNPYSRSPNAEVSGGYQTERHPWWPLTFCLIPSFPLPCC